MANNSAFWNQLLMRSDSISDIKSDAADAAEQIFAQLSTITEQFDRVFDPADQFEEYVAVAFCQAVQKALRPPIAAPICKVSVHRAGAADTPKPGHSGLHAASTSAPASASALNVISPPETPAKKIDSRAPAVAPIQTVLTNKSDPANKSLAGKNAKTLAAEDSDNGSKTEDKTGKVAKSKSAQKLNSTAKSNKGNKGHRPRRGKAN